MSSYVTIQVIIDKELLNKSDDSQYKEVLWTLFKDSLKNAKDDLTKTSKYDKYGKSVMAPTPNSQGYSMPHYPGYSQWDLSEGEAVEDTTSNKPCNHNYIFIGNSIGWVCKHCDEEQP